MRQIRAAEPNAVDPILILGAPRSGTTWLAKIFDSHPDVLYLHEPDTVLRNSALPVICRRSDIARYRPVELLAWHWGLFNQKVVDDVADGARLHVVSYERLCERPIETARNLFDAVGLAWDRRAVSFIGKSTTYHGPYRYYGVRQNTQAVKEKWRQELDTGDQLRITAIAQRFPIGRFICDAEEWGRDPTQVMKVG